MPRSMQQWASYESLVPLPSTSTCGRYIDRTTGTVPMVRSLLRANAYETMVTTEEQADKMDQLAEPKLSLHSPARAFAKQISASIAAEEEEAAQVAERGAAGGFGAAALEPPTLLLDVRPPPDIELKPLTISPKKWRDAAKGTGGASGHTSGAVFASTHAAGFPKEPMPLPPVSSPFKPRPKRLADGVGVGAGSPGDGGIGDSGRMKKGRGGGEDSDGRYWETLTEWHEDRVFQHLTDFVRSERAVVTAGRTSGRRSRALGGARQRAQLAASASAGARAFGR